MSENSSAPLVRNREEVEFEEGIFEDIGLECFMISCGDEDKFLHILALLESDHLLKKVLVFTNTIEMGYRLNLFLERFGIGSAFLDAELPQNSRLHIIEEFNAGLFDCLIAIADGETNTKEQEAAGKNDVEIKLDTEFGVLRGVDFKNVYTVINLHMPSTAAAGYIHRIRRTGRASNTRTSIFLVSPDEMEAFGELKSTLAEHRSGGDFIAPFPSLTRMVVESLRYQAEDIERTVTRADVRMARAEALHGTKIEDILGTETEVETLRLKFISK